jgi:uncharacterized protein (TIRG00374 family)
MKAVAELQEKVKREKRKAWLLGGLRLLISVGLIVLLLGQVDPARLIAALHRTDWWLIGLSTLISWASILLAAYRWQVVIGTEKIRVSLGRLFYWYMVAGFFRMFLPTVLGGDVVRAHALAKHTGRAAFAAASVVMERILGLSAMIGIALAALAVSPLARDIPTVYPGVLVICVAYVAGLFVLFHRALEQTIVRLLERIHLDGLSQKVAHGFQTLYALREHHLVLLLAFLASVLFQLLGVYTIYLIGHALGLDVPWTYYFVTVPVIWLMTMLPISINGMGVRESAFVLFFAAAGVSNTDAILLAFLVFAQMVLISLLGGALYMLKPWALPRKWGSSWRPSFPSLPFFKK